jgi:Protein of unknown function (DUF2281)
MRATVKTVARIFYLEDCIYPILHVILGNNLNCHQMTTDTTLFTKIIGLSPSLKEDVIKYIEYLLYKEQSTAKPKLKKTPKAGFSTVGFVMASDFDAPLEDFKDYM